MVLYKADGEAEGRQACACCGLAFIRLNQRRDLEVLWERLGLDGARHANGNHHLDLCPKCKRRLVARAQDLRLGGAFDPMAQIPVHAEPQVDATTFGGSA